MVVLCCVFQLLEEYSMLHYYYSIMSEVTVLSEQIQLVNIVEVVQTSLAKNFTILLKRITHHDTLLSQQQQQQSSIAQLHQQHHQQLQAKLQQQHTLFINKMMELNAKIQCLQQRDVRIVQELGSAEIGVKRLNDELFNTQLQFQQKMKVKERQLQEITKVVQILLVQQERIKDEMNKKQNKVEAEKIIKETQILKDKNHHIETQIKIATHKIQKMEILSQKAERLQAKKELEIMKEIQERVKKEMKTNINNSSGMPTSSNIVTSTMTPLNKTNNFNNLLGGNNLNMSNKGIEQHGQHEEGRRYSITSDQNGFLGDFGDKNNVHLIVQKWGEKIKLFETQLKEVNENLKILNKHSSKRDYKQNKQNSSDGNIKDRINQIKPEMVKIWAKLDTIEDKLCFSQKKLQDKFRNINDLATMIKENNVSKLQEKLKNLQTEVFTTLKELKAKLENKVNQSDYDKYCHNMEDRIVQINEMIYLKSDKLEVKKALLFLQSKIKEIILVISEDEENEKDALLTKKQLKCISCDKEIDKFSGNISSPKGNWDSLPYKEHPPQILGRFGMTNFGSLAKKIKKLQSKDLPLLNKRNANQSFQNNS